MANQPVQRNATGGAQGTDYQIKLLLHCLLSLSKEEGAQFTLDTELKDLGNWDDIVYKQTGPNNETSYRFFQLKHKVNQTLKLKKSDLLSPSIHNVYALFKYFASYQTLNNLMDGNSFKYRDKIKDVVLFTNIDVEDGLKSDGSLEEITDVDPLLDFQLSDAQVTENNGRPARYRLNIAIFKEKNTGEKNPEYGDLAANASVDLEPLLKHLVLAVNQPNEELLSELIMNSLDSTRIAQATFSYSTKSAETAYRVLESRMREFYKRPEGSTCNQINLTINDAIKWKEDIEVELGKLFNVGCYYAYHKKLDCINFEPSFVQIVKDSTCFMELERKLEEKELLFYIQTDTDPLITAMLVRAALKGRNEREQFLFTTLESALDKEKTENGDLMSLAVRMVIVDEKGSTDQIRELCSCITNQQVDIVKGFIVLISQKDITTDSGESSSTDLNGRKGESRKTQRKRMNPTGTDFDSSKQENAKRAKNDQPQNALNSRKMNWLETLTAHKFEIRDISWKDLSKETQGALKSKDVVFQGRKVSLEKFNVMEQIINPKTLVQLVEHMGVPIKIGAECFNQDANVYVPRTVNCRLLKEKASLQLGSQRFCIDQNDFQDKAAYWVKTEEEKRFLLIDSRAGINELRNYVDGEKMKSLKEKSLNGSIKVAIISDLAGMGKSSMLNSIWTKIKDDDPTKWIVKLDLNDATTTSALGRVNLNQWSSLVNDFFQAYFKGISPLEKVLFDLNLRNGKLIIMLDGFDEIRPEYQEKVLSFLKHLREAKIDQLWITTRPHLQEKLEDELGQFSLTLMPFSEEDQVNYLIRHWQSGLQHLNHSNETLLEQLRRFAADLVDLLSESIKDVQKKFTGVPLQCRMLAESFDHRIKAMDLTLPQRMNLTDLYELFWRRKCEMFLQEKGKAHGASSFAGFIEKLFENTCAMLFEKFALRWMFSEEEFQFLWGDYRAVDNLLKPLEDQIHSFGLTVESKDHLPRFIHQTVAEYFVARFLVDHLLTGRHSHKTQFIEFLFDKVLVDESRFHVVKSFINGLLCDSTRRYGVVSRDQSLSTVRRVIVVAAKDGHHKIVELILQGYWILASCIGQDEIRTVFGDRNEMNGQGLLGPDEKGWTPVHWATAHGNERVIQVIFDFAMKKGINTMNLLSPDKKYGETPMHRAALLGHCKIMKFIVKNLQNKWIDPRLGRNFKETKGWRWRLLRWSVLYHPIVVEETKPSNELNVISLLGPDLNQETTVHRAASQGNAKSVKILLDAAFHFQLDPDVLLGRGLYGETPLHRAALRGSENVIKKIFNFLNKCNVSPIKYMGRDHYGETPFHRAASRGRHKVIAFLSDKLRECNADPLEFLNPDWDHMTPLNRAAENGFNQVVEEFLKIYEDTATPVEEIFMADWNGMTPLHWAAANGHVRVLHVISEFLQKRNSCSKALFGFDQRKWTPVHWAEHGGHNEATKILCSINYMNAGVIHLSRNEVRKKICFL